MGRSASKMTGEKARVETNMVAAVAAGRVMSRALAASWPADRRLSMARAFGVRLVQAWWKSIAGDEDIRSIWVPFDTADPVFRFGHGLRYEAAQR